MQDRITPFDSRERRALRDYIRDGSGSIGTGSEVEDIIKLAIASASRFFPVVARKPEVALSGSSSHATPAFEQRIVALFGD